MNRQTLLATYREATPLRRRILREMREAITRGELPACSRLVEPALMRRWDVSRTVVREVLNQLEKEGLVSIELHKGARVRGLTLSEAQELYVIRGSLEGLAARLFAGRASDEARGTLRAAFEEVAAAYAADDPVRIVDAKNAFYATLSQGAGCVVLSEMLDRVQAQMRLYRAAGLQHPDRAAQRGRESVAHLERLLAALDQGDGARAEAVIRQEVASAAAEILRLDSLFVH